MKKKLLSILVLTAISFGISAQNVNIPDANFKTYLVTNTAINTDMNSEISVAEATAFTGTISCSSQSISDLTGIEAFVNVTKLDCKYNNLSNLDLSQNTALTEVDLSNTSSGTLLSTLNVSQCTALTFLKFQGNNISSIDLSNNTALTDLYCNYNNLSTIDLTQNTALTFLAFNGNLFSSIDLSQNTALETLFSGENPNLSSLDLSNNTALTTLTGNFVSQGNMSTLTLGQNSNLNIVYCENCGLTSLDVSQTPNITFLSLAGNSISTIDLSANIALDNINLNYNNLTSLDLSSNTNLSSIQCSNNFNLSALNLKNVSTSGSLFATANPNLTCIDVDDVADATANWTNIDATASFSLNCSSVLVNSITVQGQAGAATITTNAGSLQMEATVLPANADDASYTWSVANGTGDATIDANGLLTAISDGAVTVTATANDGSGVTGDAVITISNQSILVNSITIQGQGGQTSITTNGGTLQMEAVVLPANADDATYTWSVSTVSGDATIDANGLLTASADGTVTVTATANDGSGVTGEAVITISNQTVGINEQQLEVHQLSIFPNPVSEQLNIESDEAIKSITLLDITGKTVRTFSGASKHIDVSDLKNGVYLMQAQTAKGIASKRLIKE